MKLKQIPMKKLILLILLVSATLNAFSQKDTNKIELKTPIAKLIVKDLIKGDGCQEEVKKLNEKIGIMDTLVSQKDSLISILVIKDENNTCILGLKDQQISLYEQLTVGLRKDLRRQKNKNILFQLSTFGISVGALYLLLYK